MFSSLSIIGVFLSRKGHLDLEVSSELMKSLGGSGGAAVCKSRPFFPASDPGGNWVAFARISGHWVKKDPEDPGQHLLNQWHTAWAVPVRERTQWHMNPACVCCPSSVTFLSQNTNLQASNLPTEVAVKPYWTWEWHSHFPNLGQDRKAVQELRWQPSASCLRKPAPVCFLYTLDVLPGHRYSLLILRGSCSHCNYRREVRTRKCWGTQTCSCLILAGYFLPPWSWERHQPDRPRHSQRGAQGAQHGARSWGPFHLPRWATHQSPGWHLPVIHRRHGLFWVFFLFQATSVLIHISLIFMLCHSLAGCKIVTNLEETHYKAGNKTKCWKLLSMS